MGYKRYEKYKDSGVEWIGEIPEHWDLIKIKFISFMYSGNGFNEEYQGKTEGDYPFYKVSDINGDGKFVTIANNYVDKSEVKKNRWSIIPENSVLFPKIGEALKKNHRKINVSKCLIDNNTAALEPNKELMDINYFYYLLCCVNGEWFVNPGAVPSIDNSKLKNFKILLPPKKEQTAIANFLDQKTAEIDSLIADKEKLRRLLQEKRQAIISEAVIKGLDPNVPMKDSGVEWIGEIPEHWNITKVKYICSESAVYGLNETADNYEDDGVRLIRTTDINEFGNLDDKINGVFISEEKAKGYILKTGDILLSRSGSVGLSLYFDEEKYGKCSYASYLVKFRTNRFNCPRYLFYFTKSDSFYHQIQTALVSSTISNFNGQKYANIKLPLPSYFEQTTIANFLDQKTAEIDSLIADIQAQIAKLKEYRQSLIYEAVTGKIDVRDFTPNTEGVVLDAQNTN